MLRALHSRLLTSIRAALLRPGTCGTLLRSPLTGLSSPVMSVYIPWCSFWVTSLPPSKISLLVSIRLPPFTVLFGTAYM